MIVATEFKRGALAGAGFAVGFWIVLVTASNSIEQGLRLLRRHGNRAPRSLPRRVKT